MNEKQQNLLSLVNSLLEYKVKCYLSLEMLKDYVYKESLKEDLEMLKHLENTFYGSGIIFYPYGDKEVCFRKTEI